MSHMMKLWERALERRTKEEVTFSDEQFEFMVGGSTVGAVFVLLQLIEEYREEQINIHCIFIDLEKAYDRVPR